MKKILILCMFMFSFALAKSEHRLVVLDPASIEIIYALGAGDSIKGIATLQHSNINPVEQTSKLESVGSFSHPSIEKILSLKPSLVIVSSYSLNLEPRLKDLGIKSIYLSADRLEDLYKNITILAELLDKKQEGEALIAKVKNDFVELGKEPLNKSGIFLFSSNPLMAFADNSMIADIFNLIGVKNLTPQTEIKRPMISTEYILRQNPDILVLSMQANDTGALIAHNPSLRKIKAYENNQIFIYKNVYGLLRISPNITSHIKEFKENIKQNLKH